VGFGCSRSGRKNPQPRLMIAPPATPHRRGSPPGHPPGGAEALNSFGPVTQNLRQPDQAITAHQAAARIRRLSGDRQGEGKAPGNAGTALRQAGRYDEAITAGEDAAAVCRETGSRQGRASALGNPGRLPRGPTSIRAVSPGASGSRPGREK
jgi:hypothetical protein